MKKLLMTVILAVVALVPTVTVKAKDPVKVYIFEAGGCPYCEKQVEYLEGLEGYNKIFTIERKELYVDHIDWAQGKDFELGKLVAEAFLKAGFEDASYQGTPFVVISDKYATAGYSTALEDIIKGVYEEGDKDVVGCYASGKTDCLDGVTVDALEGKDSTATVYIALGVIIVAGVALLAYSKAKAN